MCLKVVRTETTNRGTSWPIRLEGDVAVFTLFEGKRFCILHSKRLKHIIAIAWNVSL